MDNFWCEITEEVVFGIVLKVLCGFFDKFELGLAIGSPFYL